MKTDTEIITFDVEITDTFGGEANYSWVRRATIKAPADIPDSALVRRAKQAIGLCGPHRKEDFGDTIALYPTGACLVCFITPRI